MRRRTLQLNKNGRAIINGYEVVDLGLSSGLLFATRNVGANGETDYGDYYKYGKGSQKYDKSDSMYKGTENPLASTADTATQVMGSGWRMPTKDEIQDLLNKTDYEFVTDFNGSGVNGGKFTSKTNPDAYVFFPAAGLYSSGNLRNEGSQSLVWSSTPYTSNLYAYCISISSSGAYLVGTDYRDNGNSVRGVHAAV